MADVPAWDEELERELIIRCQAGDKTAFEPIVKQYMRRAYFTALGLVGNPQSAEDLSQDAFVRVYKNIDSFDVDAPFYPWFYRILKNLCLNHIRGKKRKPAQSLDKLGEVGFEPQSKNPDPEDDCQTDEMKQVLWQAIYKLKETDREIIILKHFEDLSYKEIAEVLDIPQGTVMSRLFNARKHLREMMTGYV